MAAQRVNALAALNMATHKAKEGKGLKATVERMKRTQEKRRVNTTMRKVILLHPGILEI